MSQEEYEDVVLMGRSRKQKAKEENDSATKKRKWRKQVTKNDENEDQKIHE